MIAELASVVDTRRARIVAELAAAAVRPFGLSPAGAERVTNHTERAMLDVLRASDSLTARTAELEAVQSLADQHVRRPWLCASCRWMGWCVTLQGLRRRIRRLKAQCDHEADQIMRGRHR